jgi:uncharacterized protein (TIGR00369 family)
MMELVMWFSPPSRDAPFPAGRRGLASGPGWDDHAPSLAATARVARGNLRASGEKLPTMKAAENEDRLREFLANGRFQSFLGIELVSTDLDAQEIVLKLPYSEDFERLPGSGQIHGGITSALIDIAGDFALIMLLDRPIPTINLRIDYLSMAVATDLIATARVVRAGRSVGVVDIDIANGDGKPIAVGRGCYSTLQT